MWITLQDLAFGKSGEMQREIQARASDKMRKVAGDEQDVPEFPSVAETKALLMPLPRDYLISSQEQRNTPPSNFTWLIEHDFFFFAHMILLLTQ